MDRWCINIGFAIALIYLFTCCAPERLIMTPESPQVRSQEILTSSEQQPELVVQKGHAEDVTAVVFSADGKLLATGSQDDTVKLWALPEGKLLNTLEGLPQPYDNLTAHA